MDIIVYLIGIPSRQRQLQIDNRRDAKVFWLLGCTVKSQVRTVYARTSRTYPAGKLEQYRTNNKPCDLDTALEIVFKQNTDRIDKWKETYSRYLENKYAKI